MYDFSFSFNSTKDFPIQGIADNKLVIHLFVYLLFIFIVKLCYI